MAQIGSRLIDATAAKITDDFFKAFESVLQSRQPAPADAVATAPAPVATTPVPVRVARAGGNAGLGARNHRRRRHPVRLFT